MVGVAQKRTLSKTRKQRGPAGDQKSLPSNSLVVNKQQSIPPEASITINVPPEEALETGVGASRQNSRQQELESHEYGEMDATSKWLLAASGLCPPELIDSLSFL